MICCERSFCYCVLCGQQLSLCLCSMCMSMKVSLKLVRFAFFACVHPFLHLLSFTSFFCLEDGRISFSSNHIHIILSYSLHILRRILKFFVFNVLSRFSFLPRRYILIGFSLFFFFSLFSSYFFHRYLRFSRPKRNFHVLSANFCNPNQFQRHIVLTHRMVNSGHHLRIHSTTTRVYTIC